jgi:hypothetical protein
MDIRLAPDKARVEIVHRLRNNNLWQVELAVWALTAAAQGGRIIIPLPPRGSHEGNLLPASSLTLWAYTDMSDPRWTWGTKYMMLRQDPTATTQQKMGAMTPDGWVAYARQGHLFVKKFDYVPGGRYPDWGCSVETFTNADMLEVETVGPLVDLPPGGVVEYVERWFLFRDVAEPKNDDDVDKAVLPKVQAAV